MAKQTIPTIKPLLLENFFLTKDKGVVINGVTWATRNIAASGCFSRTPEDIGMIYQWNRKKAWAATGEISGWDNSASIGNIWEKENDPCPEGWRIPTIDELQTLLDTTKVRQEWITLNGVQGRKFTDLQSGNSVFFPAVGYRDYTTGSFKNEYLPNKECPASLYWSITNKSHTPSYAYCMCNHPGDAGAPNYIRSAGYSIRPIAKLTFLEKNSIPFDYNRISIASTIDGYQIVQGSRWLLNFKTDIASAIKALEIIKFYKFTHQCFVGNGIIDEPSMLYYLCNGKSPVGEFSGEDAVHFNLSKIEVKQIDGRWKIVEGSHWIMDFNTSKIEEINEKEATQAFAIIQKYGFTKICFVGRPNPPMIYFRQ